MRTDVKIGLLCVFVVILGTVIYFVVVPGQSRPKTALGGDISTGSESPSAGNGLATPRASGTGSEAPAAAPGSLSIAPPAPVADSHTMDIAPGSSSPIGQQLAQATPPGGGMSGGMIAPPPSPSALINPSQGTGLATPSTLPAPSSGMPGSAPPLSGGLPISPNAGRPLIPSTAPSGSGTTLLGGSNGTLETPHREIPTPGGLGSGSGSLGGSDLGGSSHFGGMGGSSGFGGSSLLGSSSSGGSTTHAVEKGDTFGILAKKYGVTINAIAAANPGVQSNNLKIGKVLTIPAPSTSSPKPAPSGSTSSLTGGTPSKPTATTRPSRRPAGTAAAAARPAAASTGKPGSTYTVKKGDTLGKIAETVYGDKAAWKKIYQANREQIADADVVTIGQVLKLP